MAYNQGNCRIWWDDTVQGYRVVTPYRPNFVDLLKQLAPGPERVWDGPPTNPTGPRNWIISERIFQPTKDLVEKIFGGPVIVVTKQQWQAQQAASQTQANTGYSRPGAASANGNGNSLAGLMYEWFQLLPYDSAKKAYRDAALQMHPDRGGNPEVMSKFNSLWTQIEKLHYQK